MIFASADARFGFPEISLGTIPGMGGTQRLTKTVGKQKVRIIGPYLDISRTSLCLQALDAILTLQALELVLTGLPVTAREMEQRGVVNRVVLEQEDVCEEALSVARLVLARSAPALRLAKHAVKAGKSTLSTQSGDAQADRNKPKPRR